MNFVYFAHSIVNVFPFIRVIDVHTIELILYEQCLFCSFHSICISFYSIIYVHTIVLIFHEHCFLCSFYSTCFSFDEHYI